MLEPFEESGRWWVQEPAIEPQVFNGRLRWCPFAGATLELDGLNAHCSTLFSQRLGKTLTIQGQLDTIPRVTLEHAMVTSANFAVAGSGRATILSSNLAKGGDVLDDFDQTQLKSLSCEMTGLNEWVGGSSLRIKPLDGQGIRVDCIPYSTEKFAKVDGIDIHIGRWNRTSTTVTRFSVESVTVFDLQAQEPFSYGVGRKLLDALKGFLTLAIDGPVTYIAIRGEVAKAQEGEASATTQSNIQFFQTADEQTVKRSKKVREPEMMPLLLHPITQSGKAFAEFRRIYAANRMAFDFFFSQVYGAKSYINQQFADLVHGLEGLHRGVRGGQFMNQDEYDAIILPKLVEAIPTGIDPQLRQALKKRLEFGNEFSLRRRLKELARTHEGYARGIIGKPNEFADTVADMRNELAHAIGTRVPSRETVTRYFVMLHRVRVLFQLEIFYQLGFDDEFLRGCVRRLQSVEFAVRNV